MILSPQHRLPFLRDSLVNTLDLKGNLLNMFVALAMGGVEGYKQLEIPFDEWGTLVFNRASFYPERDVGVIWAEVLRLRISTNATGDGRWEITLPVQSVRNQEPFPPYICDNPLDGYRMAITWSAYGSQVPDVFESSLFGRVELAPYNVDFDVTVELPS